MRAAFMDAMAVTGRFKKPHLFITKTTNPNWPEIQRELIGDEKAVDRPDLVARVFRLKKEQMLDGKLILFMKEEVLNRDLRPCWQKQSRTGLDGEEVHQTLSASSVEIYVSSLMALYCKHLLFFYEPILDPVRFFREVRRQRSRSIVNWF
jgi:hypothetical protein